MRKIAVFASGYGSNFQSLIDAEKNGKLAGNISLLVSDKANSFAIKRAEENGIPFFTFEAKNYGSKEEYESIIVELLRKEKIDLIVLAGFMRIVGTTLLKAYANKIINLHPSLLPSFPGINAIGQAYDYGVKITGVTVHFVDEGMDTGPIIKQKSISVENEDTIDTLTEKIHRVEHELLLKTVNLIINNSVRVTDRKVIIDKK